MLKRNHNVNVLYIGSKMDSIAEENIKLREKMTKKERLIYSRYRDISDNPITEIVDEKKVKAMFGFHYKKVDTIMATEEENTTKERILKKVTSLFNEARDGTLIVFSGHALRNGSWIVERPDEDREEEEYSICYEDIHDIWAHKKSKQRHLLIIIDSNYSGHWCRRRMIKPNATISIQANGRYWDKSCDDKKNGSFFIHNLFKVVKQRQKEIIVEPYINTNRPYFWGDFEAIYEVFGLFLNYICWHDMRQALGISKYGYWPRNGQNITGLNGNGEPGIEVKNTKQEEVKLIKREGMGIACRDNGIIEYEGVWKNNKKHGQGIEYDENGLRKFEGDFLEDKKVGKGKEFFEHGGVKYDAKYQDDVMIGDFKEFYEDGVKKFDGEFVKAFDNNNEFMEDDSEPDTESEYEEPELEYPYQNLLKAGNSFNQSVLPPKARVVGIECDDLQLNKSAFHKDQKSFNKKNRIVRVGTAYYNSGIKKAEGRFINGIMQGKGRAYHPNGALKYEGMFRKGIINGFGREFWDNNNIKYEGEFVNGIYYGEGRIYNKNGVLLAEGTFIDGKMHGMGTAYYLNGNVMYEGEFQDGKALGVGLVNYNDGDIDYIGKDEDVLREAFVTKIYDERRTKREFEAGQVFPINDKDLNRSFDGNHTKNFDMEYKETGQSKIDLAEQFRVRKESVGDYASVMYSMNKSGNNFRTSKIKVDKFFSVNPNQIDKTSQASILSNRSKELVKDIAKKKKKPKMSKLEYLLKHPKSPVNDRSRRESYLKEEKQRKRDKKSIDLGNVEEDIKGDVNRRNTIEKIHDYLDLSNIEHEQTNENFGETIDLFKNNNNAPAFNPVDEVSKPSKNQEIDIKDELRNIDSVVQLSNASDKNKRPLSKDSNSFNNSFNKGPFGSKTKNEMAFDKKESKFETENMSGNIRNNSIEPKRAPDVKNPKFKPTIKDDVTRLQKEDMGLIEKLLHLEQQVHNKIKKSQHNIKQDIYKERRKSYVKPRPFLYKKPGQIKPRQPRNINYNSTHIVASRQKSIEQVEPVLRKKGLGAKLILVNQSERQVRPINY